MQVNVICEIVNTNVTPYLVYKIKHFDFFLKHNILSFDAYSTLR